MSRAPKAMVPELTTECEDTWDVASVPPMTHSQYQVGACALRVGREQLPKEGESCQSHPVTQPGLTPQCTGPSSQGGPLGFLHHNASFSCRNPASYPRTGVPGLHEDFLACTHSPVQRLRAVGALTPPLRPSTGAPHLSLRHRPPDGSFQAVSIQAWPKKCLCSSSSGPQFGQL